MRNNSLGDKDWDQRDTSEERLDEEDEFEDKTVSWTSVEFKVGVALYIYFIGNCVATAVTIYK